MISVDPAVFTGTMLFFKFHPAVISPFGNSQTVTGCIQPGAIGNSFINKLYGFPAI